MITLVAKLAMFQRLVSIALDVVESFVALLRNVETLIAAWAPVRA